MDHLNKDALDKKSMTRCGGCMKCKQTVAHFPSQSMSKTMKVLRWCIRTSWGP